MRKYSISRQLSQLWECKVTDSYGKGYIDWFETEEECHNHVLHIWDNEMSPEDKKKSQNKAIRKMVDRDERNGKMY